VDAGGALDVEQRGSQSGAGRAAADEGVRVARGDGTRREHDRRVGGRSAGAHGVGRLGDGDGGVDDLDPLGHVAKLLGGAEEHDAHPLLGCVRRARGDFCGPEVGAVGVDRDRDGHAREATQSSLMLVVVLVAMHVNDLAAAVGAAHRADTMGQARAMARRAGVVGRRLDLVLGATLGGAGV
jgi:hypothetical protein